MGMFDSFYDADGNEWQTKAFGCNLDRYTSNDNVPASIDDFQVEVLGGMRGAKSQDALATIRDRKLSKVPDVRDESLPLMDYHGYIYHGTEGV